MLVQITLWTLGALLAGQALLVIGFLFALLRFRRHLAPDEQCPKAAVILCLRGTDPFLARCLTAVLAQDYPRFSVRVVVDHTADPAWQMVQQVVQDSPSRQAASDFSLVVEPLAARRASCSLKCSSVVQAINGLDDSYEFIAQLDADTIPHPSWLREMATALSDERVGAATGNRWYMPEDSQWGSLVRYAWNAAAVVQMYWYHIAWGGTLAVKTRVIREAGLLDRWSHSFCEDTMLFTQLRQHGWQVAFVPSLMMVNRESCDLGGFLGWVRRQLLTARLYHPGWSAVVGHGLGTTAALAGAVMLAVSALVLGDFGSVVRLATALAAYELGAMGMLVPLEIAVRRIVSERGENAHWLTPVKLLRQLAAVVVTQVVYPVALLSALFLRQVTWRQAVYQIDGPWKIRLLRETRYELSSESAGSSTSL